MRLRIFLILMISYLFGDAQEKIALYPGKAPGSETWNWEEKELLVGGMRLVFDVVRPELIAYVPVKPNGTAVIIAPGGAFHALAIDQEGTEVAKWLNAKGVTAFVLKYLLKK